MKVWPLLCTLMVLMAACSQQPNHASAAPTATVDDRLPLAIGDVALQAQIAVGAQEMSKGLMHRQSMPENEGMLFVYSRPQQMSFWMRNTYIPLDVGFFDGAGNLLEVRQMYPHDESPVRSASSNAQFALEMNQGWFRQNNIKPGAKFDTNLLKEALLRRGVQLEHFRLE